MKKLIMFVCIFFIFMGSSFAFTDTDSFIWAQDAINKWSKTGFLSGYPDGTFRGNNKITRAEVIAVINKLNNSKEKVTKRAGKDIEVNSWFFNDMGKAVKSGLIDVEYDGNLRPNELATREEVMVVLSKLFNIIYTGNIENAKVKSFIDNGEISSENYYRVAGIIEEGFVNGYKDGTLRPKASITRAEFVSILNNAIQEVISTGMYDDRVMVGNIVINNQNVVIKNSEINGRVFVLDGARDSRPTLINTKISKGINSRVGEVLIKDVDDFETLSEYNDEYTEEYNEVALVKIDYSETDWTNDDVKIKVKFYNDDVDAIDGNTLNVDKNGEYIIRYAYKGKIRNILAKVNNIDKTKPVVTAAVKQNVGSIFVVDVSIEDDGLSPIKKILFNGIVRERNKETGEIGTIFNIMKSGEYEVYAEDEAGNVGKTKVNIDEIQREVTLTADVLEEKAIITVDYIDYDVNPVIEIACSNGVTNRIDLATNNIEKVFEVDKNGEYTFSLLDRAGNVIKKNIVINGMLNKYEIKYDLNGGEGNIENQIKTQGRDIILTSVVPTKTECSFLGWNSNKDATEAIYISGGNFSLDQDIVLYAIWEATNQENTDGTGNNVPSN